MPLNIPVASRNYLVTGLSGVGKSSVYEELVRRGYAAISTDRTWAYHAHPDTGLPGGPVGHDTWVWDRHQALRELEDPEPETLFVCGSSRNIDQFLPYFTKVFYLRIDDDTMRRRLEGRTDDDWPLGAAGVELMLALNREGRRFTGAIDVDATRPLDEVVDQLLRLSDLRPSWPHRERATEPALRGADRRSHSAMLLWLNGTFGVGKTTTGREIVERLPGWRIFDPEWVGLMLRANLSDQPFDDFQKLAAWRVLVPRVAEEIRRLTGEELVAVQTVLVEDYWSELRSGFQSLGLDVFHVVLDIEEGALRERIAGDLVEDDARDWRLAHIETFRAARPWMTAAADLVVDVTELGPQDAARSILRTLGRRA